MQLGLLAGGLVDGTVNLWNPASIVGSPITEEPCDGSNGCLVTTLQKHVGAVSAAHGFGLVDSQAPSRSLQNPKEPASPPAGERPAVQFLQHQPSSDGRR